MNRELLRENWRSVLIAGALATVALAGCSESGGDSSDKLRTVDITTTTTSTTVDPELIPESETEELAAPLPPHEEMLADISNQFGEFAVRIHDTAARHGVVQQNKSVPPHQIEEGEDIFDITDNRTTITAADEQLRYTLMYRGKTGTMADFLRPDPATATRLVIRKEDLHLGETYEFDLTKKANGDWILDAAIGDKKAEIRTDEVFLFSPATDAEARRNGEMYRAFVGLTEQADAILAEADALAAAQE